MSSNQDQKLPTYTLDQVRQHNKESDCWVAIRGKVYNLTKFLDIHPGGKRIIMTVAGQDGTKAFELHHDVVAVLHKYDKSLVIGRLEDYDDDTSLSYGESGFGERIAFAEPNWYQEWRSPYYTESHRRLRSWIRNIMDKEVIPYLSDWEKAGKVPQDLYKKFGQLGVLACVAGTKTWPELPGFPEPPCGIKRDEWDAFHALVIGDEISRCASAGIAATITLGPSIALPPVIHFGSEEMKRNVVADVVCGRKTIALAITEPYAGSDVANITATATLTDDGKHYIINGEKKWITNGVWADYFVVAARTGKPGSGMGGISLFLAERSMGIETRPVHCQGNIGSGTAYVVFENIKVPKENIIGGLNKGFKCIMFNFNSERLGIITSAIRASRVAYEVAMTYANKRRTFGQKLFSHGVIRNKLAHMARQIEASQAWMELIVYQLKFLSHEEAMLRLGGPIALLKAQSTVTMEYCAKEAVQILGGLGYTKGGIGDKVERIYRDVRGYAIPGGSEEIMLDLGIRQALKVSQLLGAKL